MQQALFELLLGILGNAVHGYIAASHSGEKELSGILEEWTRDRTLWSGIDQASRKAAEILLQLPSLDHERVRRFLGTTEFQDVARGVAVLCMNEPHEQFSAARRDFVEEAASSVRLYLGLSIEASRELSSGLCKSIESGVAESLRAIATRAGMSAGELRSVRRHQELLSRLANTNAKIELLTAANKLDGLAVDKFEHDLRDETRLATRLLSVPSLDVEGRVPLEDAYVASALSSGLRGWRRWSRSESALDVDQARAILHRTVILGGPGAGKSTLLQHLAHSAASQPDNAMIGSRKVTPVIVSLRHYAAECAARDMSIAEFIEHTSKTRLSLLPPVGALEYMLICGRLAVLFDGLDEVVTQAQRGEIRTRLESFARRYPYVPMAVTSREIGYEQAELDHSIFDVMYIAPFDDPRVVRYARQRFSLMEKASPTGDIPKAEEFLKESRVAKELRSTPLLLGLLCTIYRGQRYIEPNLPTIYEKCAQMLFERWDRSRGMSTPFGYDQFLDPLLQRIADEMLRTNNASTGMTEAETVKLVAEILHGRRYEEYGEAMNVARHFVQYCRDRAWVFSNIASQSADEPLFEFTHRTFLEYFAAKHLVSQAADVPELTEKVYALASRREQDVVAQLAVQLQNQQKPGAADRMLIALLAERRQSAEARSNIASFVFRCMPIVLLAPATVRQLVAGAMTELTRGARRDEMLAQVPLLYPEARKAFADEFGRHTATLMRRLADEVGSGKNAEDVDVAQRRAVRTWEAVQMLEAMTVAVGSVEGAEVRADEPWREALEVLREQAAPSLRVLARRSQRIASDLLRARVMSPVEYVGTHGLRSLLGEWRDTPVGRFGENLLVRALFWDREHDAEDESLAREHSALLSALAEHLVGTRERGPFVDVDAACDIAATLQTAKYERRLGSLRASVPRAPLARWLVLAVMQEFAAARLGLRGDDAAVVSAQETARALLKELELDESASGQEAFGDVGAATLGSDTTDPDEARHREQAVRKAVRAWREGHWRVFTGSRGGRT